MSFIQQSAAANQRFSSSSSAAAAVPFTNNNYVQRKQLSSTSQGGLTRCRRRSTSGSDTDVSTSNENLSNEERYVIRHTARQEPQGQENQQHLPSRLSVCSSSSSNHNLPNVQGNFKSLNGSNRNSLKDNAAAAGAASSNRNSLKEICLSSSNRTSLGSNRSSLDVSTSSYNTLIIHNANEDNLWAPAATAAATTRLSGMAKEHGDMAYLQQQQQQQQQYCESVGNGLLHVQRSNSPESSLPLENHIYVNTINQQQQQQQTGCQEITDIPDDYLNQSQVLKHLAKEVRVPSYKLLLTGSESAELGIGSTVTAAAAAAEGINDPRGRNVSSLAPGYAADDDDDRRRTTLKIKHKKLCDGKSIFSRSQPDLSRISSSADCMDSYNLQTISPRPQTKGREEFETPAGEIWPTLGMVELLIQENSSLKLELDRCYKRVAKSQQLESDIQKVQRAHKDLVCSSERREKLERAARSRLQSDCRRLTELNRALRDQIDLLSTRSESSLSVESVRKELQQKDLVIGQLINSTKELAAAKERQEIELAAQRATLQEQRTHIDILDTALTNAQSNVVRLEEECRKKQVYVERVGQLQRALSSLQASSDRREETERQLRVQLERELREGNACAAAGDGAGAGGAAAAVAAAETVHELKRKLRERNEKIMSLEGDVAKWEQRYLEESALRQAAIDAASLPKDAKIAALEKTSQEAEKLIAEAHAEKMRQMDKVHACQKKLADLESRMKELESKLAERDAMIRVLQKHTYDKADAAATSSSSGVGSYQAGGGHSSHSSSASAADHHHHHHHHHHTALASAPPELVSSVLGGGSGYGSTAASYGAVSAADFKYSSSSSSSSRKQASFEQTNKSLDDQLKELDSQLVPVLSKDSLIQALRREKEKYPSHYWRV